MTPELSAYEQALAHDIPAWAVARVVPAPKRRGEPLVKMVSYHVTRASAVEDQERRGGPSGDETEGFDVFRATLLDAFKFGAFSVEEVRRQIERETGPLEPEEQMLAARTPLWTVWYEDRFGYGEDRDPAIPEAHFFTEKEAEAYAKAQGGPPAVENFAGYTVTRGTLLEAATSRIFTVNAKVRELLAKVPPDLEDEMLDRVRAFVAARAGVEKAAVSRGTRIVDDLRITGRDGASLMAAFFETFGVNPGGFAVTRYFAPEKIGLLGSISTLMGDGPPRLALSVDDLVAAAMIGRWLQ